MHVLKHYRSKQYFAPVAGILFQHDDMPFRARPAGSRPTLGQAVDLQILLKKYDSGL
jgi:hypothetical protein